MRCVNCGTELLPGKQFCHACGHKAQRECPSCGSAVDPAFRFCPDCGNEFAAFPESAQPPAEDTLARLSSAMPEGMAQKIRDTRASIEGERKQVTVLFCDLAGSTAVADKLDPEEYHDLLERYLALAFHEIYRFEGIVNQLAGDGLMALFGAPIAHEDAPQRAVWAALAIRDSLAHFNEELFEQRGIQLPARIGIHTGPVVVGTVGNDLKMDYTAIGDTTNLASRLESLAKPGTVLVSDATARLVRGFFSMEPMGPFNVKGKSEPIDAYEVRRANETASPMAVAAARGLTPLVGRDEELAQLEACFQRLQGSLSQVVSVVGDAGSGKSRLLYEFKRSLGDRDVVFFEGRCEALNQSVPYHVFIGMLRQYFDLRPGEPEQVACERVANRVRLSPEQIDADYPLLCELLSVPTERATRRDMPPEALKRETFRAVTNLVTAESRKVPVVMLVEDLQWIDEPSRELIEMAVGRLARARVMVLASHRPDFRPMWRTNAASTQLTLRPLSDAEITEIMRSLAGGPLPAKLEESILNKAEGSPFFVEEITRALLEEGYLTKGDNGASRLSRPLEEIPMPGTVQEVLAARLDRLGPAAKRVAQVAAVLGRQFRRSQITALVETEAVNVDGALVELAQRGVIHRKTLFEDDEFRFGESLTQEVAYEGLLLKQRRQLHERIALALESDTGPRTLEGRSLIAHHYALSDNRAKAVDFLLQAAHDAEQLPSYRAALGFYRRAWELADSMTRESDPDMRAGHWLVQATLGYLRVTVLYGSSTDPLADAAALRGTEMAEQLGEADVLGTFYLMHGIMLTSDRARFSHGVELVEKGFAAAQQSGSELQVISASRARAWNYALDGRFQEAYDTMHWIQQELERLGQKEPPTDLYVSSSWMLDSFRYFLDDLQGTLRAATATHDMTVRANNRTIQSSSAILLSHAYFLLGDYPFAKDWADRALKIAEGIATDASIHRAAALALAARVQLGERGNVTRFVELVEHGVTLSGNLLYSIGIAIEALISLGDLTRAEYLAQKAHDHSAGRLRELLTMIPLADVRSRLGPAHWQRAQQLNEQAIALAEAMQSRSLLAVALLGAGELAEARGDRTASHTYARRAHEICVDLGMAHYLPRAERLLATEPVTAVSA